MIVAVPAEVSWAAPSKWAPVQKLAEASQKFTWPTVTFAELDDTAAVSVTAPQRTVVTAFPPEEIVRVVVVAAGAP